MLGGHGSAVRFGRARRASPALCAGREAVRPPLSDGPALKELPMDRPPRIIVLDDEAELRNMLQRFLTGHGFEVRVVEDSRRLDRYLEREPYDLLVLDLMIGEENGLEICSRLRARGETLPILMLTAKGDPLDKVVGLETGADDYLAKPFLPRELVARIRALLRRQKIASGDPTVTQAVSFGDFRLDVGKQQLTRAGEPIEIHSAQMLLLAALGSSPNRPVSRDNLIARARGRDHGALDRSIDVQVLRLRQIIEDDPSKPRFIKTVWGVGYMLIADVES
jgi:two-component system, OmpR family, phosphate regulon response regulator OmpR